MSYHTYYTDQELPGIPIGIYDVDGATLLNFGSGFTATVQVVRVGGTAIVVTQSTSITLYSGVYLEWGGYNLTIDKWASGTLTAIAADLTTSGRTSQDYEVRPYVRRTSDSADEVLTSTQRLIVTFRTAAV